MKIGIDGRLLTETITGIGRYKYEMIAAMLRHPAELRVYCPSRPTDMVLDTLPRDIFRYANFTTRPGRLYWSQTRLSQWSRQEKIDVFWGPTHRLPLSLPEGIPAAVTIHDLVWRHASQTMRPLNRWLDRLMMPGAVRRADMVLAVSKSTARDIAREWPEAASKTTTVYPGIAALPPPQPKTALKKFGLTGTYFLFVGTLEPRKNLAGLLHAYYSLPAAKRDFAKLVIAGSKGWGKTNVRELIGTLGLQDNVIITGYATDQDLATLYAHARFLAMPSLYEGFGLPLVEAMAFGTPVLTSNISSMPEVAGNAGILVDPRCHESIMHGMASLLFDDGLHHRMGANAVTNAGRFSWDDSAEKVVKLLAALK